jgi:argininosuccinate lyase
MAEAAQEGFSTATEVADYLVRRGLGFREAHAIVGQIVQHCERTAARFESLSLDDWQSFSPSFSEDILDCISAAGAVAAKASPGGTAPERVREQIGRARALLAT